jgi:hypothetical protein
MNWFKAIWSEYVRAIKLTFATNDDTEVPRNPFTRWRTNGWTSDRHLRAGFYLAGPIFVAIVFPAIFWLKSSQWQIPCMFGGAVIANIIWLGYAAWSRRKSGE